MRENNIDPGLTASSIDPRPTLLSFKLAPEGTKPVLKLTALIDANCDACGFTFEPVGKTIEEITRAAEVTGMLGKRSLPIDRPMALNQRVKKSPGESRGGGTQSGKTDDRVHSNRLVSKYKKESRK